MNNTTSPLSNSSSAEIVTAKDGHETFCLHEERNGQKTIHFLSSQYNPQKEAERILNDTEDGASNSDQKSIPQMIFILGAGNPSLVQLTIEKYQQTPIVLVENHPQIPTLLTEWLKKQQGHVPEILWLNQSTKDKQLKQWLKEYSVKNLLFLQNQKQIRINPKFFWQCKDRIIKIHNERSTNRSTIARFEKLWLRNITNNTTEIIKSYPLLACKGLGKNIPTVIVGAGPSLGKVIGEFEKIQKHVIIIACDTVVKVLLNHNITPDLIVMIDPQKVNSKYLENIPKSKLTKSILICEPGVVNQGIRDFPHTIMFDSIFPYYRFLTSYFNSKGEIDVGGTVISACYEVAKILECSPIAFIGMDFCYQEDTYHLKGTMYEEIFYSYLHRYQTFEMFFAKIINNDIIPTSNHLGETVYIDKKFILFKNWLETKFANDRLQVYNCSWGGITLEGLECIKFQDFIHDHVSTNIVESTALMTRLIKEVSIFKQHRNNNNPDFQEVFHHFTVQYQKLLEAISSYQKLLKKTIAHIRNRQMEKVLGLQEQILNGESAQIAKPFVEIVVQKTLYDITQDSGTSVQSQYQNLQHLYQELHDACTLNLQHLKKVTFDHNYLKTLE